VVALEGAAMCSGSRWLLDDRGSCTEHDTFAELTEWPSSSFLDVDPWTAERRSAREQPRGSCALQTIVPEEDPHHIHRQAIQPNLTPSTPSSLPSRYRPRILDRRLHLSQATAHTTTF
jgi:hypothetical protein